MKKSLGPVNAMYPMPVVIVGTEVEGKPNFITIAHVGILDMGIISLSINKTHYSNAGIRKNMALSINVPSESMIVETDYVGIFSGVKIDKSGVFKSFKGELQGAPMLESAPLCMECKVDQILDYPTHEVFVVSVVNTYCEEDALTDGKIDIEKVKPFLFDMLQQNYWQLGPKIGKAWTMGLSYKK